MKVYKFSNETFEFDLHFVLYGYADDKDKNKLHKVLCKGGMDASEATKMIEENRGTAVAGRPYYIVIDVDSYKKETNPVGEFLKTLQHECNHIRQYVIDYMNESVTKGDLEAHLRISDWCFKKCVNTKFVSSLFKKKKVSLK